MITIVLVGTGNVAQNLFQAFYNVADIEVKQVIGRNENHLSFAKNKVSINTDFNQIPTADVYILAVSDDAIALVAEKFKNSGGLIVHTSGGTALEVIGNQNRAGVFYPLQTFTKGKLISFDDIPICLEATNKTDLHLLQILGKSLSKTVELLNSEQRRTLHIAAVFVNNFTNYMYTIGEEICAEHMVDFKLLHPLIKETAAKLDDLSPKESQTGPAKRGDQKTLQNHLKFIENKHQRELYTLLSNAIKCKHG
ncbi:DUF2520 domain-containing protein [Maribacter sp. ACAM166]|nr:DUF2520 domain-containing protein [Maribacter sp. ACAM166]